MNQTKDMTVGKPWKLILIFAFPIFLSNFFQQLYNSVDSLIVGKFIGKEALAAVSSSGNLIFLFTSFFIGTMMGAGVVIANYFGKKDYENMQKAIHTVIAFGLIASVILTAVGVGLSPFILRWMRTDENVLPSSIIYFRNYFLGSIGIVMYNVFNSILQSLGNSRRPLYYLIFSSLLNIALDLLFIGVFKWGVGAAALASAISQITSAFLCFLFLIKKGTIYQVQVSKIRFYKGMLPQILKIGVPAGVQNSVIALANVFVQSNINTFGEEAMAGCGTYAKIEGFAFLPITCFSMALTTFISQNLGAKEYERAKIGSRFGVLTSIILAEIIGVLTFAFAPFWASLFTDDENVIAICVRQCRVEAFFFCLLAFSHCIAAICRGSGRAIVPMLVMLIVWCFIRVSYISIIMLYRHEIQFIFYAYPMTWGISSIFFLFYYLFSNWQHGFERQNSKQESNE